MSKWLLPNCHTNSNYQLGNEYGEEIQNHWNPYMILGKHFGEREQLGR